MPDQSAQHRACGPGAPTTPADVHLVTTTEQLPGGMVRILVEGELDLATTPRLRTAVRAAVVATDPPIELRLDLAGLRFIDAVGVGELVRSREAARRHGVGFSVCNPQGLPRRLLEIFHLIEALQASPRAAGPPGGWSGLR